MHEYWNLILLFYFYMLLQVDLSDHDYFFIALITGHGIGEVRICMFTIAHIIYVLYNNYKKSKDSSVLETARLSS